MKAVKIAVIVLAGILVLSVLKAGVDYVGHRMAEATSEILDPLALDIQGR